MSLLVSSLLYTTALHADDRVLNIHLAAQPLAQAVEQLAKQANIQIVYASSALDQHHISALSGQYTIEQALQRLVQGRNLSLQKNGAVWTIIEKPAAIQSHKTALSTAIQSEDKMHTVLSAEASPEAPSEILTLSPITLYGVVDRDTQGYNAVYSDDISSVYAGKEQIERYKGAQPADLFKGMVGVYSGDARNSGALDPSIRGIQGPGRVPVLIDGTEQALTVWRGYNGANNRSYIDPNLIGGLQVIKGPSLTRNVNSGVGGAVVISTLSVNDVLKAGKNFGGEIKVETSSNAVKPREPQLLTGQSIYDNPNYPPAYQFGNNILFEPFYDPSLFKPVRSSRENSLYSGDDVAGRIALAGRTEQFELLAAYAYRNKGNHFSGKRGSAYYDKPVQGRFDYTPYLAKVYPAGTEVPNTSLETESYLIKAVWKPTDEQRLELGYRDTAITNGEILPSRIAWDSLVQDKTGVPQWPLSHTDAKAYNLEYKYQPQGSRLIDFYSNLWRTDTQSATYSAGGFPNDANKELGIFVNSAVAHADNTRQGVTISNKFNLFSHLDLTLGGSFQKEKLSSEDMYRDPYTTGSNAGFKMLPRAGEREEREFNVNVHYQPSNWLTLNAGVRYQNYWAFDRFLADQVNAGDASFAKVWKETSKAMEYYTKREDMTPEREQELWELVNSYGYTPAQTQEQFIRVVYKQKNKVNYKTDERGKYTVANNPFLNGTVTATDYQRVAFSGTEYDVIDLTETGVQKKKDHGWTPTLSATVNFSSNSRIYLRYSEAYRMPSMFESTIGFSGSQSGYKLEPEHAHNYEVAYIHDFSDLFKSSSFADIKLSYYHNKTENAIERSPTLVFSNVDSHTIEGLELQSRFDNGRFFTDFSANYNLQNKVCDEHSAMLLGMSHNFEISRCVDDGFVGGYLLSMATPKYSAHWTVGGRWFDQQLELGARASYMHKYENPETKNYNGTEISYYSNTPLAWNSMIILDAYVNYRLQEDTVFELVGTNLTDEFYIDPLTRSSMAAPGRTLKLSISHKF
ncbi:TonB-dependent receptor [Acinetobacter larvae]|uniref:TonB-dependent receptor n=2 Tax=Acinetobacter larvae TaxID=1789224 RepID=A0A1B2LXT1_9GAMM|nr:TonB-dependent receptor [Acinetobacter larvae]